MNCRVEHFKRTEFLCPCCGQGEVARVLVLWLDLLRRAWGSKSSRHKIGCAADIRVAEVPSADPRAAVRASQWPEFAALAARLCRLPEWEVGRPNNGSLQFAPNRRVQNVRETQ